ncbi:MAG: type II toxin-antitoxin system Phd/YefM family antitoxin [Gammaproteobacteria bacterium]|nr:MAG: type II toxin-antitoxin system Phd/YefM family antitoxin [Gammaproteobacteria bacterium]
MQVNILDAKNRLSELLRRAQAGEEVTIANRGRPVARLVPVTDAAPASGGRDMLDWLAAHPLADHQRRATADIDAAITAEREAWD